MNNKKEKHLSNEETSLKKHVEAFQKRSKYLCKKYAITDPALEAKDIAQETAIRSFIYQDKYNPEKSRASYFQKIMLNVLLDQNEKRKRRLAGNSMVKNQDVSKGDADSDLVHERTINRIAAPDEHIGERDDFFTFLSTLPKRQREYCEIKIAADAEAKKITDEEIAKIQRVTRQTVISDKKKAKKAFMKYFMQ